MFSCYQISLLSVNCKTKQNVFIGAHIRHLFAGQLQKSKITAFSLLVCNLTYIELRNGILECNSNLDVLSLCRFTSDIDRHLLIEMLQ